MKMKKFLFAFLAGLLLMATSLPASSQYTLQSVSTKTSYSGVEFNFTPIADASTAYIIWIESKEGTYYQARYTLSDGPSGVWTPATFAFNTYGTAPGGYGPPRTVSGGGYNNALQCDGGANRAVVQIVKVNNGIPASVLGYSQVISFTAPNWGILPRSVVTVAYNYETDTGTAPVISTSPSTGTTSGGKLTGNGKGK